MLENVRWLRDGHPPQKWETLVRGCLCPDAHRHAAPGEASGRAHPGVSAVGARRWDHGACGGLSGAIFNFSLIYRERGFTQVSKVFSLNGAKRLHFTLEK